MAQTTKTNGTPKGRTPASKGSGATRARTNSNGNRATSNGAADKAKGAGKTLGAAMSKAKTPLILGGTAVAGVAAGAIALGRLRKGRSKNPLARLRALSVPKPSLDKLDLETVKSAADRVTAYGKQASDMASALEKTQKKHG